MSTFERVEIGNAVLYRGERHFETACRRIEQAQAQGKLFGDEPQRQPEQMVIA